MNLRKTVDDFRCEFAEYTAGIAAVISDDNADDLLSFDEALTKLTGVQNFLSEVHGGTAKHSPKALRSELWAAHDDVCRFVVGFLENIGSHVENFRQAHADALAAIEWPSLDRIAADGILRQEEELERSIENAQRLMANAPPKRVAKAARAVGTKARRIAKTQLLSGLYVGKQVYISKLVDAVVRPAFVELRKLNNHLELSNQLLELVNTNCESLDAESGATADPFHPPHRKVNVTGVRSPT